ncbi:MAG: hypothetical protein KBG92_08720 [Spirochaetes bacterium]|nr:hypothetical protein [Spirochaetota bacterium]
MKHAIVILLLIVSIPVQAQMPDWAMMKDREGNTYYFDKSGKIYTDENIKPAYKAVAKDELEYYTSKVKTLWKAGYRKQALTIAKSIMALRETSQHVINGKKDIAAFLRENQMKHGNRFVDISREAWLYLTREDNRMYLFNDKVPYIVSIAGNAEVISAKSLDSLQYSQTVLRTGIRFTPTKGYDAIMTIAAESFAGTIESVNVLQQHWKNVAFDTFQRTLIKSNDSMALYSFITADALQLVGLELFMIKENRGYMVRIFTTKERFNQYKDDIAAIIDGFSTP